MKKKTKKILATLIYVLIAIIITGGVLQVHLYIKNILAETIPTSTPVYTNTSLKPTETHKQTQLNTGVFYQVEITAYEVTLRNADGIPTGDSLKRGQALTVYFEGEWAYIVGGEGSGLKIWRGCTSSPGVYGCRAQ